MEFNREAGELVNRSKAREVHGVAGLADHDIQKTEVLEDSIGALSDEFHADLEWWGWALNQQFFFEGVSLCLPFFHFARWHPTRHWLSDATPKSIRGYCVELCVWWRYALSEEEQTRSSQGATCANHDKISITILELLATLSCYGVRDGGSSW